MIAYYEKKIEKLKGQLNELLESQPHSVGTVRKYEKYKFDDKGVYLISEPDDNEHVYVGLTNKGFHNRIEDHHNLDKGSNLRFFIHNDAMRDNYLVRCLKIEDKTERYILEHFAISVLQPKYNHPKISK